MNLSLNELADRLDVMADDLPIVASNMARDVADAIANDLIVNTPVDVGDAMSGWTVSLDTPALDPRYAYSPSPKGRMIHGVWTHTVDPIITFFANVGQAADAITQALLPKQPGQSIWIVNNHPYIRVLDDGSSKQQPAGFVDRALVLAQLIVGRAKVIL